tara:strand:+ start:156 stop:572 length:417 start_codon:yes stop_codon:yes gene_type:complete
MVFDNDKIGRLKLISLLLERMELDDSGRVAILSLDQSILEDTECTYDDTEGLVNLPLSVRQILAVMFLKHIAPNNFRVSLRSKSDVDIRQIATRHGGGGHKNAAGFTATGHPETVKATILKEIVEAVNLVSENCARQT